MRYLNTLYITQYQARIRHRRGSLIVSSANGKQRVPLEELDSIVLFGGQLTTEAITQCTRRNIRIAALAKSGRIRFIVGGPTTGNVHLRLAQYRTVTDDRTTLELCRLLVAGKLRNSNHILSRWSRDHPDRNVSSELSRRVKMIKQSINRLVEAPTTDHVRGIEGDAARLHYGGLRRVLDNGRFRFHSRIRRPPRDPVNAALSFCYSLLVTEGTGACDAVGLDPQIGFLHTPRSGRPSLALDFSEELRPLVDRFIIGLIRRRQLSISDFLKTPGGAVFLSDQGRKRLLRYWEEHKNVEYHHPIVDRKVGRWALPSVQATLMARFLRGDLDSYPPFILIN